MPKKPERTSHATKALLTTAGSALFQMLGSGGKALHTGSGFLSSLAFGGLKGLYGGAVTGLAYFFFAKSLLKEGTSLNTGMGMLLSAVVPGVLMKVLESVSPEAFLELLKQASLADTEEGAMDIITQGLMGLGVCTIAVATLLDMRQPSEETLAP